VEDYYAGRKDVFALLAPGADLYFRADVSAARPILDGLSFGAVTGAEVSDFLDMSDSLAAALYGSKDASQRFLAAASGKYPGVRGGMFFSASADWEKARSASGIEYWHSEKSELSVFLSANRAFFSDADPFVPPPGAESPAGLSSFKDGAALSGWMENPAAPLSRIAGALGIPVEIPAEKMIFAVYPSSSKEGRAYKAVLRLETKNPARADALVRLFTLARAGMALTDFSSRPDLQSLYRIFFAEAPAQDGSALVLTTGTMQGRDIALLFNTLSVYSK
jgi:hypothetical protein